MDNHFKSFFSFTHYAPADIYPVQYGEEQCAPNHDFGPCIRSNYIIHYVYSGKGVFRADNRLYRLTAGQMFLICPNQLAYYKADENQPWLYRWIEFNGSMAQRLVRAFAESPVVSDNDGSIGAALLRITDGGAMRFEVLMQHFWAFAAALTEKKAEDEYAQSEDYVEKAELFVKNNVHKKITVNNIADHVGINRSYLSRLFRQHKGVSPQQYILTVKLNTAAHYLQNTDITVEETANSVGYADYHIFSKAFKRMFGTSPSVWRQKQNWEQSIVKMDYDF